MEKTLRDRGMLQEGCQFYFLARTLMGVVAYSQLQLDKAYETLKGVLAEQLVYVNQQEDHPFLEQTYQHLALYYKMVRQFPAALLTWQKLYKVQERMFGVDSPVLVECLKNIAMCQMVQGTHKDSIETYQRAIPISEKAIRSAESADDQEAAKFERSLLCQIYFSMYLASQYSNDHEKALEYNERSRELNAMSYGEDDVTVANCDYLAAQLLLQMIRVNDALPRIDNAIRVIELKKENPDLMVIVKYHLLKAKLLRMQDKHREAFDIANSLLARVDGNLQLSPEQGEIKRFRSELVNAMPASMREELKI